MKMKRTKLFEQECFTALHHAVVQHDVDMINLLLARGARRDVKTKYRQTPIELAEDRDFSDIVELLEKN